MIIGFICHEYPQHIAGVLQSVWRDVCTNEAVEAVLWCQLPCDGGPTGRGATRSGGSLCEEQRVNPMAAVPLRRGNGEESERVNDVFVCSVLCLLVNRMMKPAPEDQLCTYMESTLDYSQDRKSVV